MNPIVIRLLVLGLVIGVAASESAATQVIQQSPKELARASTLIVDGTVSSVRSYWNEDRTKIFTETTIAVGSTHKGEKTSTVRIIQPGGVVGNVRQTAHGALSWRRGEEVLVMLEPAREPGLHQIAGFSQGKFAIERDKRSGKAFVRQSLPYNGGKSLPASHSKDIRTQRDGRVTLEQFLLQVLPKE
jgi:hypothetical protein